MNKILILITLLLAFNIVNAQKPLTHLPKIYQSPEGKLYIQKEQPIYLYLSTQPNGNGEMVQLQSDSTKAFANPMYLDTEGYNSFRSPSAVDTTTKLIHYPLTDVVFELYADSRPPRTKLYYDAKYKYSKGMELFLGGNLNIQIIANDAQSGVEQILVSIDSIGFNKYTEALSFNNEKRYDLNYYAVDNVGNVSPVEHLNFFIDKTPPQSELYFDGNQFENTISGKTMIKIKASDNNSGVKTTYYSVDNQAKVNYSYPLNSANLIEGEHTITYYSVDNVGNIESEKTKTFFVDKTPPILVDEIMGTSYVINGKEFSSGRAKLKLTAVDNKSGVSEIMYSLNNESFLLYEKPFYLTTVSGALEVTSYAVDNVGNKSLASEKSTNAKATYVDLTGPYLKYNFIGKFFKTRDTIFINKDTRIKLYGQDEESGLKSISYIINNGKEVEYTEPFNLTEPGAKILNIYGYDNVDNSNREQANLMVDNLGPDIFSRFSILPIGQKIVNGKQVDIYSSQAVLFLSATDAKVAIDQIYYAINDEPEKIYTGIVDGFKRGKDYSIKVKAYDKLGNVNIDTIGFATDNTGPQIFVRYSVPSVSSEETSEGIIDTYPVHAAIFLSVTDAHVAFDKIYYSINGTPEKIYQGIIDGFKAGTDVIMNIRAVDRLGNQTDKAIHFKIAKE